MIALKLQMGISPCTQIAPGMLLAMWQQLKLEKEREQADLTKTRANLKQEISFQ